MRHIVVLTMSIVALLVYFAWVALAMANPPVPGSEDFKTLMPFANWISEQKSPGGGLLCCSVSDCRTVSIKMDGDHYLAYIPEKDDKGYIKFPKGPNAWLEVPDNAIKHSANPTGAAVACWSWGRQDYDRTSNGFYCFFPPDLV